MIVKINLIGIIILIGLPCFLAGYGQQDILNYEEAEIKRVVVEPVKCVIVLPLKKNDKPHIAKSNHTIAEELQKHLHLVTDVDIAIVHEGNVPAGQYPFYIQKVPLSDKKPIIPRESRWTVTQSGTYFYGDIIYGGYWSGAQSAVYSFLEDQLNIRWTEPGDIGISYKKQSPLKLKAGAFAWKPELMFNNIRSSYRVNKIDKSLPAEKILEQKRRNRLATDAILWQKRMKMGGSRPGGGHTFAKWWKKYGKTHPEYFALNKFGKREPVKNTRKPEKTDRDVKICPSNHAVAKQIVKNWLPRKKVRKYVNACMNDGTENFCECENCKKLDVVREGEKFGEHMTDRYVYLANTVAREVKKSRPDAWVTMYAYLTTMEPPRKIKLEPNIVVQAVPYITPLDLTIQTNLFRAWSEAGAKKLALRPNYHHKYLFGPFPLGIEKQMFDIFQALYKQGVVSVDYDSFSNNWALTSMTNYILAHAFADPSRPFTYWEKQYYQAYGPAAKQIESYYKYWRNEVFEKRLKPNIVKLAKVGRYGNFSRGLLWSMVYGYIRDYKPEGCKAYYSDQDFDTTDEMLENAAKEKLSKEERYRVNQLILANQRAHLVFSAITTPEPKKFEYSLKLQKFIKENKHDLRVEPLGKYAVQSSGLKQCSILGAYALPWLKTSFKWQFKMDPKEIGLEEKWYKKSWSETKKWKAIRVNTHWSDPYESPHIKLKKTLKEYDGVGWYSFRFRTPTKLKGRKIFLHFGGVDDSCWVYVNGRRAGEHIYRKKGDENAPFDIRIDSLIDWEEKNQHVVARVQDLGGKGGIHKPVWIVSKH